MYQHLKAILRCDPDVILIGEIRNASIANVLLFRQVYGHLVLSTIHANNCKGTLLRLLEMGISVQEICQSINLISNQRLITTLNQQRALVCEMMINHQIEYFLNIIIPCHFIIYHS